MAMKVIFTGQFFKLDKLRTESALAKRHEEIAAFSVANSIPAGYEDKIDGVITELIPDWRWVKEYQQARGQSADIRDRVLHRYEVAYKRYLMTLDCQLVYHRIIKAAGSRLPFLLCWERNDHPCHRHWIRDWFKYNGIPAMEWTGIR